MTTQSTNPLMVLKFLSTGLIKWQEKIEEEKRIYPYPYELRIGLDRLATMLDLKDKSFPGTIGEAFSYFSTPINKWGLEELDYYIIDDETLMEDGQPTDLCYEMAVDINGELEAELTQRLILDVLGECKILNSPNDYNDFRRKLIENPIIKQKELFTWVNNISNINGKYFTQAYEELPASTISPVDGNVYVCGHCGWILEWTSKGNATCDSVLCKKLTDYFKNAPRLEGDPNEWVRLKRGLLRFVSLPGRAELRIEKQLNNLNLEVELWPEFDQYDLRITFPDGEVWGIDVKDWASPFLLANSIEEFPDIPSWNKAFFVVPDYREQQTAGYRNIFLNNWKKQKNVDMLMEKDFLNQVKSKLG